METYEQKGAGQEGKQHKNIFRFPLNSFHSLFLIKYPMLVPSAIHPLKPSKKFNEQLDRPMMD